MPSRSHNLFERAQALSPGGVHSPVRSFRSVGSEPFFVARGEGAYLFDVDGKRYVDYVGSWGPLILGHAHPKVVEAIRRQAELGTSYGACCELEVRLAELVVSKMPSLEMIRFVNSGTEATMSALRLARAFTKRPKIVKFAGCYHGHSDGLLVEAGSGALTLGIPGSAGVAEETTRHTLTAQFNHIETVESLFKEFPDSISAVIVEPVVGNCGFIAPEENFLRDLREVCTKHGALLIFDEVMTGFRVHPAGAQTLFGVRPDLTTLGKIIGGGLPVGAYGGLRNIMSLVAPLGPVYQAGTLSGNPLAMAAGLATLEELFRPGVFEGVSSMTAELVAFILSEAKKHGIALSAGSAGGMFGFYFSEEPVTDYAGALRCDRERFVRFFKRCLELGVYFAPSAFEAGFVSAAHEGEPLEETKEVVREVFAELGK